MADKINLDLESYNGSNELGNGVRLGWEPYGERTKDGVNIRFKFGIYYWPDNIEAIELNILTQCSIGGFSNSIRLDTEADRHSDGVLTDYAFIQMSTPFDAGVLNMSFDASILCTYSNDDKETLMYAHEFDSIGIPYFATQITQPEIEIIDNKNNTFKINITKQSEAGENNPVTNTEIYYGINSPSNLYPGGNIEIDRNSYVIAYATSYDSLGYGASSNTVEKQIYYIPPYVKINALYNNSYKEGTLYALYDKGDGLKYYPVIELCENQNGSYTKLK